MTRTSPLALTLTLALTGTAHAAQILGPWSIESAPIQASLVSGGGSLFNWLNVVNAPLTVNQALTQFPLADTGYADANSGTIIDLTYAPGQAVNNPGDDLVLLDARYSFNSYTLYSSSDGFTTPLVVSANDLSWTGETRDYYVGSLPGAGSFPALVMAYGVDLSFWGVPLGSDVITIRVVHSGFESDLLGLGVLTPVPAPAAGAILALAGAAALRRRRHDR